MNKKARNDLLFLCLVIELIARKKHLMLKDVVAILGKKTMKDIFEDAEFLHCEDINNTVNDLINKYNIHKGNFFNFLENWDEKNIPSASGLSSNYVYMVEKICKDNDYIKILIDIYNSWVCRAMQDYRTDIFTLPIPYLVECYYADDILDF